MLDVIAALRRHFCHDAFRDGQEALVAAVLSGRDVLAVMPTGSGKSLGFQLPAVMLPGTTIVVSPLIALMKDQVDELKRRGIPAAALHSLLAPDARRIAIGNLRHGRLPLLYVAPERFASDAFVGTLREVPVSRFVIDEAHCVSEWGHDFRPDYRRLKSAAADCRRSEHLPGRPPIAAFTATATPDVRDDVVKLLGLEAPQVLVAGFDRANITLRVQPVDDETEKQVRLPRLVRGRRALVYAATRRSAESSATVLVAAGITAAAYHAGLPEVERTRVQNAFADGSLPVVCATNAFGMGIDRPDVEAVVHVAIPGSIEAYYQEIGRAGRDGRPATATLLWDVQDIQLREFLIDSPKAERPGSTRLSLDPEEIARRKNIEHQKLRHMIGYAESRTCLRATILRYFGDPSAQKRCGTCGNCSAPGRIDPGDREVLRKVLAGVARAGERYGRWRIVAMLVGELDELPPSLTSLSTTGLLRDLPPETIAAWIDASVVAGLLTVSTDRYRTLSLTPLGRDVMRGGREDIVIVPPRRNRGLSRRPPRGTVSTFAHPSDIRKLFRR
jgi:ATP-dependent DNA helicase RecQ